MLFALSNLIIQNLENDLYYLMETHKKLDGWEFWSLYGITKFDIVEQILATTRNTWYT